MATPSVFSYGGGVQSTACLVLQARGEIRFDHFVMADVGDDSENPETIEYMRDHAVPFAEAHGITLATTRWERKAGFLSLKQYIEQIDSSIPIPVNFGSGPVNRLCTLRWKINPVARYHKALGATSENPGRLGLGFSTDEIHRCRTDCKHDWQTPSHPLIDLILSRQDCVRIVEEAGLPTPVNSCCWFCPFQRRSQWEDRKQTHPNLIADAITLEETISTRTERMGKGRCWIGGKGRLEDVLAQQSLFADLEDERCSGASCFT